MGLYMLDTNMASFAIKKNSPSLLARMQSLPVQDAICISAVTEGELRFGVARKPQATVLRETVENFLRLATVLDWGSEAAAVYGSLRAAQMAKGRRLELLDLMIAAHAIAAGAILVTHDRDFRHIGAPLLLEDWAPDVS